VIIIQPAASLVEKTAPKLDELVKRSFEAPDG
jgi:hypothetical protein